MAVVRGPAQGSRCFLVAALGGALLLLCGESSPVGPAAGVGHCVRALALETEPGGSGKRAGLTTVVGVTAADATRSAAAGSGAVAPREAPRALGERGACLRFSCADPEAAEEQEAALKPIAHLLAEDLGHEQRKRARAVNGSCCLCVEAPHRAH